MTDITALTIAIVCLYSTGHWIGATVLLGWTLIWLSVEMEDLTGIKRLSRRLRS